MVVITGLIIDEKKRKEKKRTVRLRLTQTASLLLSLEITQSATLSFPRQSIKTNNANS